MLCHQGNKKEVKIIFTGFKVCDIIKCACMVGRAVKTIRAELLETIAMRLWLSEKWEWTPSRPLISSITFRAR